MQLSVCVFVIDALSCSAGPRGLCLGCDGKFLIQVELNFSFVLFFHRILSIGLLFNDFTLYTHVLFVHGILYFTLNYLFIENLTILLLCNDCVLFSMFLIFN